MDEATQATLRAIISGLESSGVLNDRSIDSIVEQLRAAASVEAECDRQDEADAIRALADDIEADTRLDDIEEGASLG